MKEELSVITIPERFYSTGYVMAPISPGTILISCAELRDGVDMIIGYVV